MFVIIYLGVSNGGFGIDIIGLDIKNSFTH